MNDDRTILLENAWLPPRACTHNSRCRPALFVDDPGIDPKLRAAMVPPYTNMVSYFLGRTTVAYQHSGKSYDLLCTIVRALALLGVGAKLVHMLDLEEMPQIKRGLEFEDSIRSCEFLAIAGFYQRDERPKSIRRVMSLLNELDCSLLVQVDLPSSSLTGAKGSLPTEVTQWWSPELINSLGAVTPINITPPPHA